MLVLVIANRSAASDLWEICEVLSRAARKYQERYGEIPVLIIDNANKMGKSDLEGIQDYAKHASDHGIAAVVLVTTEGHVPRHMMRKLN
jgi:hypothetical protein